MSVFVRGGVLRSVSASDALRFVVLRTSGVMRDCVRSWRRIAVGVCE
ncbi:MAG: hypothetical protein IJR63_11320 [Synergistaceae bacterium]|nr:hypothetical protein [Synergistaceae bacterium]